ncbi:Acetyltransferase (GNAT) family protein [Thalassobacillus cyri]|uniref:Acetyltransferase (GNAT) family protein n=1 Tax=Thalassobacillus cyri TaxID=571932 RepID=A0A1H3XT28_9BACI|nr:GNAT family N-acetyltransferase [Thalassobacillus cyri]SEA02536.1 Acetyltransferase (GNAT) family protein [Thalassobacillus cyri]
MLEFKSMNKLSFQDYINFLIPNYAEEIGRNFNKPSEKILEDAYEQFAQLLPDGLDTADHYLLDIHDTTKKRHVGKLWYHLKQDEQSAYIYHLWIEEPFRRKGLGYQTLKHLENELKAQGITTIGLNVFGDNKNAYHLYKKMGYHTGAIVMEKVL